MVVYKSVKGIRYQLCLLDGILLNGIFLNLYFIMLFVIRVGKVPFFSLIKSMSVVKIGIFREKPAKPDLI